MKNETANENCGYARRSEDLLIILYVERTVARYSENIMPEI